MNARIAAARLDNQGITSRRGQTPEEIVGWLGAVQAQDLRAATWAIGLRLGEQATAEDVRRAVDDGRILRTHLLRPTWHFVTAADIHWMLDLTAPHVRRRTESYYRSLGLDVSIRTRGTAIIERALASGEHRTRAELGAALKQGRLPLTGVRLAVLTLHAELEGIICSGSHRGTESTYALLSHRVPKPAALLREEAIAELTLRYLRSHAPATLRDFVWWSGLSTADARTGLGAVAAQQARVGDHVYWRLEERARGRAGAAVHLLPIYDEYLVAYRDLDAVPRPPASSGVLPQAVIAKGQVAGTWKPVRRGGGIAIEITRTRPMTDVEHRAVGRAAARYARFFGLPHLPERDAAKAR